MEREKGLFGAVVGKNFFFNFFICTKCGNEKKNGKQINDKNAGEKTKPKEKIKEGGGRKKKKKKVKKKERKKKESQAKGYEKKRKKQEKEYNEAKENKRI